MSGLAGVLRLDGASDADDARVARSMLDTMAHRGAVSGVWQFGGVTLAWRQRGRSRDGTTRGPIVSRDGRFAVTYDGRVDNRDEMCRRLGASRDATDDELFAEGLSALDLALFTTVVADFAIAAWDDRARRLILARDALGICSLYWARDGNRVWWASELQAMLEAPWYVPRVCEGYVAEYLATSPTDLRETPYAGIERLPQAHTVVIEGASVRVSNYWRPPTEERRGASDGAYAEGLFDVLDTAVRARMPEGRARVGFHLSGGLDSSTVAALGTAASSDAPIKSYSLIFPGLASANETPYIDAMTQHLGARPGCVDPRGVSGAEYSAAISRHRDFPDSVTGEALLAPMFRAAHRDGIAAMLTGFGGDQWLAGNSFRLAEDLRQGRFRELIVDLRRRREATTATWPELVSAMVLPNVPSRIKQLARPFANARRRPLWITPAFAKRAHLADRLRAYGARGAPGRSPSARESIARVWCGDRAFYGDRTARASAWWGIELRHPFLDRRVVEYVVALPDEQRYRDGRTKDVLRRAMSSLLPPVVRDRTTKANMSEMMPFAIEALDPDRLLTAPHVVDAGWVDGDVVRAMLTEARRWFQGGPPRVEYRGPLWVVLGLEMWLRQEGLA